MNDLKELQMRLRLNYLEKLNRWETETEMLRIKREAFYAANPNCQFKDLFMQVVSPPTEFKITIID